MRRREFFTGLSLLLAPATPAQTRFNQLLSQKLDTISLPGQISNTTFLSSLGARRISAIIFSEIKGRAFMDVTNNQFNDKDYVFGVTEILLIPNRSLILGLPIDYLVFNQVRLRILNEDKTFGRIRATLSVLT